MERARGSLRPWFSWAAARRSCFWLYWRVLDCFKLITRDLGWNFNFNNYQSIAQQQPACWQSNNGMDRTGKVLFVPPSAPTLLCWKQGKKWMQENRTVITNRKLHKHHDQDISEKTAETQPWNVFAAYQDSCKKPESLCISRSLSPFSLCHWVAYNCWDIALQSRNLNSGNTPKVSSFQYLQQRCCNEIIANMCGKGAQSPC